MAARKRPSPTPPAPAPTRITDDEYVYHREVLDRLKTTRLAWAAWAQFLAQKYTITANDLITEDGSITRGPS